MKVILIAIVLLANSILGYFLAIWDIYTSRKASWISSLLRPWSKIFDCEIKYNLSMDYIVIMTIFGPIPKIFINLIFLASALIVVLFWGLLSIYIFIIIYFGSQLKFLLPVPENILKKNEERLAVMEAMDMAQHKLDKDESSISLIAFLLLTVSMIALALHFFGHT